MKTRLFITSRITVDGLQLRSAAISRKLCSSASPFSIIHLSVKLRCFRLIFFLLFIIVPSSSIFYLLCILYCNTLYMRSFALCIPYCNIFVICVAFTFAFDEILFFLLYHFFTVIWSTGSRQFTCGRRICHTESFAIKIPFEHTLTYFLTGIIYLTSVYQR